MKRSIICRLLRSGIALWVAFCCLAAAGCVHVEGTIAGTPTPAASPTPLPPPFTLEMTAAPVQTDVMGKRIESENHYFTYYLSFGDMRVYEYDNGTFLDGVVINSFLYPLKGELQINYYNNAGRLIGTGNIHTAENGPLLLEPGTNKIYAEIHTDVTVQDKDYVLEIKETFQPVLPEKAS